MLKRESYYSIISAILLLFIFILVIFNNAQEQSELNIQFGDTGNILKFNWRFKSGGTVPQPPIIQDKVICFGTIGNKNTNFKGSIYAINIDSGVELWRTLVQERIPYGPAASNETVCFFDGNTLHAVDINTGKEKWNYFADIDHSKSMPIILNNSVYFHSDSISLFNQTKVNNKVYSLDLFTGEKNWIFETTNGDIAEILKCNEKLYIVLDKGIIYALEIQTGKLIWQFNTKDRISSKLIVTESTLYIGCSNGNLYAVDANNGISKWIFESAGSIQTILISTDKTLLFSFGSGGYLYCIEPITGLEIWKYQKWADDCYDLITSDNLIYLSGESAGPTFFIYAIDIEKQTEKWHFSERFVTNTPPVIEKEKIFFGCGEYIYILNSNTGQKIAQFSAVISFSPFVFRSNLYFINKSGQLSSMKILSE